MHWIVAGLIGGVVAYFADFVMWSKVFTKGMEPYATWEGAKERMGGMLAKSAALALVYGVLFAFLYRQFMNNLWVEPGIPGGMEFATVLWLPIALATLGSGVWYDKVRTLFRAQFWAWLVRMNAAGIAVGLLVK